MTIQKMTIPGTESAIWGEPDNINFFLNTDLVPDTAAGRTVSDQTVRSHTRRQYPGDTTPINVSTYGRQMLVDPGRKSGNALPGSSFRVVSDAGLPGEENRQFTLQGRWEDLVNLFVGDAAMEVQLYSPSGTRYVVEGTTP
jgi:hypothetical protein